MRNGTKHMETGPVIGEGWQKFATFLTHAGRQAPDQSGSFVNMPVERGSTVVFPSVEAMEAQGEHAYGHRLVYGAMGNPVQHRLEQVIAALEGGAHTQVVNSGLAACSVALLAFLKAGDHLLLPDSVYGPTRRFALGMLARFGVETSFYPPHADEATLRAHIKPNTAVIFAESPGSHTFEVQDIPLIARMAHGAGARLLLDNTWGIGAFQPFTHGVDVSIQALTKYPSGHADVILGSITVQRPEHWQALRRAAIELGACGAPDDCWLTLRGLKTMAVRLSQQARSAYELALWLESRPEVAYVRHPALPGCPGYALWKRDFTDASGLFGVELVEGITQDAMIAMLNGLNLFGIGVSWGGYESLVLPTSGGLTRSHKDGLPKGAAFRIQVGLENVADLKADLTRGLDGLKR
ncbi:cystathionine beta-lyase [Bombella sp. TMW 2.2543]|uniref:Cystathionine beta-lyase n=1 Tax=Bombella pluederhausensis TaxID=2967336 RepID=A0ABT3WL11_9PROT|nr:cystathionine beta-lyase [Bombella pluederhausensis]MCX5617516.1 cystathionine beta-lyase [Bombella pluederhausensis]